MDGALGIPQGLKCLRENFTRHLIFRSDLSDNSSMSRFKSYSPEQAYLLPPSVRDELGANHLCFFVRGVVERLDMSVFESSYSVEGGELYAPQLMLGVWLYAYALGITSARQVERRVVEDLAFRYLAGGARVDNWALSAFRRRHGRALNDAFTRFWSGRRRAHGEAGPGGD